MVVLPSTSASRYHNCCTDGGTSLEKFVYNLVALNGLDSYYVSALKWAYVSPVSLVNVLINFTYL